MFLNVLLSLLWNHFNVQQQESCRSIFGCPSLLQTADYDQQNLILATVFGFLVLCCLGSYMICSHVGFICHPEKSVLKSKEQQEPSELRPSYSSLTAEEQEKEQEKVRKSCRTTPGMDGNIVWSNL